jgi:hypothetical protein
MLQSEEKYAYRIAMCAATDASFSPDQEICPLCKGCGLLPHPNAYMGIAPCYFCSAYGVIEKDSIKKKAAKFDPRECCNANSKTLSA